MSDKFLNIRVWFHNMQQL